MKLVLDENILAKIVHPASHQDVQGWFQRAAAEHMIYVPEPADYELRRELVLQRFTYSLDELDDLKTTAIYLPCTTAHWLRAADLWAEARRPPRGSSSDRGLDVDMLIAAQALAVGGTVVTNNLKHFRWCVSAMDWHEVPVGTSGGH